MLSPILLRALPALSLASVSTMPKLHSSALSHLTLPNSNGSRTRWRASSLVNTDGLEHPNLLLLFIGCQSSSELITRSLQLLQNSFWPDNLPTRQTQYLNMFLFAYWGQTVRVHCQSLAQKQSSVRTLSGLPLYPSGIDYRLTIGTRHRYQHSAADSKHTFFRLAFE